MIKDVRYGRPEIYMIHCYNPVYVNGECQENIDILSDENLMPFLVSVDAFMIESTALADLILPDVTYLERLSWGDMVSYEMVPEFYIRQPVIKPLGEVRQFQDVCIEIARRLGINMPYSSTEEYVKQSCEMSGVDFEYLVRNGVWQDPVVKPLYLSHARKLEREEYTGGGILFDENTGVYWNWRKSKAKSREEALLRGYRAMKNAYKGYVGRKSAMQYIPGLCPIRSTNQVSLKSTPSFWGRRVSPHA